MLSTTLVDALPLLPEAPSPFPLRDTGGFCRFMKVDGGKGEIIFFDIIPDAFLIPHHLV